MELPQHIFLSEKNKQRYLRIVTPIGRLLGRLGLHPNVMSVAGLILSVLAGLIYSMGYLFWGAWVVVLAGTCDVLDGELARQTGKASRFGAFFDSSLDRFSELFIFLGLAWHYSGGEPFLAGYGGRPEDAHSPWVVLFIILAIAGSFMVSYTRARAEGLGVECKEGWFQRPERITLLVIGSLLGAIPAIGPVFIKVALFLLAILSNFTALQRIAHVKKELEAR
jgi:CDP-diacylglycerol--glycerol-3-phosphate 3-phosphatidyltransferase